MFQVYLYRGGCSTDCQVMIYVATDERLQSDYFCPIFVTTVCFWLVTLLGLLIEPKMMTNNDDRV